MESEIGRFFEGQTVFLTGGTGFMGKSCVEHLLRKGRVARLYLLVRPSKHTTAQERLKKLLHSSNFDGLRRDWPEFEERVLAVEGDMVKEDLGLSRTDLDALLSSTTVVLHFAASTSFVQSLKSAVAINLLGTYRLHKLASLMNHLKAFVYVSTAFCHGLGSKRFVVEEKAYEPTMDFKDLLKISELDDATLKIVTPKIISPWPNTYSFVKALSESIIWKEGSHLPVAIFRPGLVFAAQWEPEPGWLDKDTTGFMALAKLMSKGVTRITYMGAGTNSQVVPVDFCSNAVMSIVHDLSRNRSVEVPVYNLGPHPENELLCTYFNTKMVAALEKTGLEYLVVFPSLWFTNCWPLFRLANFFLHVVLGYIVVGVFKLFNRKTRLMSHMIRLHQIISSYHYFLSQELIFMGDRSLELWRGQSATDRRLYNFNMLDQDWDDYIEISFKGLKKNILCEPLDNNEKALKHVQRLYYLHLVMKACMYLLAASVCWLLLYPRLLSPLTSAIVRPSFPHSTTE